MSACKDQSEQEYVQISMVCVCVSISGSEKKTISLNDKKYKPLA